MPAFGPVGRRALIRCRRQVGFEGPYSGGKQAFMVRGDVTLRIPNPRRRAIGKELLSRILHQAGIEREEWEKL